MVSLWEMSHVVHTVLLAWHGEAAPLSQHSRARSGGQLGEDEIAETGGKVSLLALFHVYEQAVLIC